MSNEEKLPYFSKRIRLADVTSPKECLGLKERTIEVIMGNSEKSITYKNPQDIADTKQQNLKDMLLELFKITDEVAVERNFKFVDKYVKEKI